ncbi:MAG TPA: hypothetical protein PLO79_09545 [Candidatus Marinimicrobia bacterium]|nr:hypothetical protein [Candidatus Neomarinimicrobiota bacterium]
MEPTRDIEQQEQVALSMVLNANPMDTLPEVLNYLSDYYYQNWIQNSGIDISYIVSKVVDKDDSIYVVGDSLNTMISANITVSGAHQDYSFNSGKIYFDSITVCYYDEFYWTFYSQSLPFIRDKNWQIQAGCKYSVSVKTEDGNEYSGFTQVPGEFHFLPWEDGKYLKKVGDYKWKIRWSSSSNGYEYALQIWGFNDNYNPGRYTETRAYSNDCEHSFEFYFCDRGSTSDTPGVDAPYPNKFFAELYVCDENLYRYKYLLQEPAGWTNCLGVLGSTNLATIVFEQDLE